VSTAHWDELERLRVEVGPMCATWRDLGEAAGSVGAGVVRVEIDPAKRSTPVHRHGKEEELVYVLGGSGFSWQDGEAFELRAGDCAVHRVNEEAHTLVAGPDGLDVLIFGTRHSDEATQLPRAGVVRINETWVLDEGGPHPFEREAAAGELAMPPQPSPRPPRIVALEDVEERPVHQGRHRFRERDLGRAVGSVSTGMSHVTVVAGHEGYPPHCHGAEEELFVVLGGSGLLLLGDDELPVRRGSVVARPPSTGVAHAFRADDDTELTFLAWGTREPNDIAFFPRSDKIYWRGVRVVARVERLDYWDGEA
jgi:uncharacterized cupin superfamily protein